MIKIMISVLLGERRMTQADLSRMTGIRPTTINELYHEITERVSLEHIDLICEALDCELQELLARIPNPIPKVESNRTGHQKNKG